MQEFQTFDTVSIQVRSVLNYMYALGYTLDKEAQGRFVTESQFGQGNRYLSTNSAVKLHNAGEDGWYVQNGVAFPNAVKLQNGFNPLGVHLAMASKLVEQVKFNSDRNGKLVIQSDMIKPLNKIVKIMIKAE